MEIAEQVRLKLHGVDFPTVSFNALKQRTDNETPINISIVPKVFYPKEFPNQFKIIQDVALVCDEYFTIELVGIGNFELAENISDEQRAHFVNNNAPAIMFPFVRAFISTLTSSVGFLTGTIIIPPHFFNGQLEEYVEPEK